MVTEIVAAFDERLRDLGLGAFAPRFATYSWTTFGRFAFSSGYVPGQGSDAEFVRDVVVVILGAHLAPEDHAAPGDVKDSVGRSSCGRVSNP